MNTRNKIVLVTCFLAFSLQAQNFKGVLKIDDLLRRIKSPDTLYIVNFWATWCKPCIQELPAFDSLYHQTNQKPIKVLLVSLDFKEELPKKVKPFLAKNNIQIPCYLLDETNGNDFIDKISKDWSGAIPATLFKKGSNQFLREKKMKLAELENNITDMEL